MIKTRLGDMDESLLQRRDTVDDNDDRTVSMTEYCLLGCNSIAHKTGKAESDGHFCNQHVHRSVHVVVKKMPSLEGATGVFS